MAEKVIFSSRKKEPKASSVVNQEAQKKVRKKKSSFATKGTRGIRREIYRLLKDGGEKRGIFVPRPRDFAFENQMPKEKIILLLRRHWITNLSWLFVVVLMSGVPLLLKNFPPFIFFPFPFRLVGVMIWYLFVFAVFLEHFFSWYFSVNIITDERIVDIDFISLIHKRISEAKIENIQDVTYKMGGLLGTVFNFGTVYIQTAAEKPEFEFEKVANPALVVKVLERMKFEEEKEKIEGRVR